MKFKIESNSMFSYDGAGTFTDLDSSIRDKIGDLYDSFDQYYDLIAEFRNVEHEFWDYVIQYWETISWFERDLSSKVIDLVQ